MSIVIQPNQVDEHVDGEIYECLNPAKPNSFFLYAGAGSGKTRSLVNVLEKFKGEHGKSFRLYRQKIAIITYTNAAADEISRRLQHDAIFQVSTIHSFCWELIKNFTQDIKEWIKKNLQTEIAKLEVEQSKSRDLNNKTSIDRARKIESKQTRNDYLDNIVKFVYNPNGGNATKDSLNHTEVISIAAAFIGTKELMQNIIASMFPIILVDESQDTKKEMIDALFVLQSKQKEKFTLGLFGDTMQRIYSDGKENLDQIIPEGWAKPLKKMNHRSNKRIIALINDIRKDADAQSQVAREEKNEGCVRLFICSRNGDKATTETSAVQRMAALTQDTLWNTDITTEDVSNVKYLILEHHMAANRMGFLDFFQPLYKVDRIRTGLLDGTLPGLNLLINTVLPLVIAHRQKDKFAIARVIKKQSGLLKKEELIQSDSQTQTLARVNELVNNLLSLWDNNNDPTLYEILHKVKSSSLFPLPNTLNIILSRTEEENALPVSATEDEEEDTDNLIDAWDEALQVPFSQIEKYALYLSDASRFGTHQGVKGLEYPRVMVIIDDEEAKGFLFAYDKLFGTKGLTDRKNITERKETGIERTRRLFYVACSRAKESLAIVAYTDNPELVRSTAINYGWFKEEEIEFL